MERILVLGATGNIGSLIAQRLYENAGKHSLWLASSRASGAAKLKECFPDAEVVQADWNDPAGLRDALNGVDRLYYVTPDFVTDETVATTNVINAVRNAGTVSQVVRLIAIPPGLTSADLSAETLATACGAALHTLAKPLLDASGLPLTYVNVACWIMFNLPWFLADEIKNHQRLAMPKVTDASRRWVSEDDIADVIAAILMDAPAKHVGRDYLMTGVQRHNFSDVAGILSEATGKDIPFVDDDTPLRTVMGDNFDAIMTYFAHETRDYGDVPASDAKLEIIGKRQETLAEYIKRNIDLFK